ncbi:hypothetical protein J6590_054608 [Homalodisca vitripennis]|nr:hypothetical protein J6590_054608 [Homalodisca vitripennis]
MKISARVDGFGSQVDCPPTPPTTPHHNLQQLTATLILNLDIWNKDFENPPMIAMTRGWNKDLKLLPCSL